MITQDQIVPLILDACPSFQERWDALDDKDLVYVYLGDFARHLFFMLKEKRIDEFPAVGEVIERLHVEGDTYVKEAATIGLLEGIQSVWSNNDVDPEEFVPFLLPESKKWWKEVSDFWQGKISYVGAGLSNKADAGARKLAPDPLRC